MTNPLRYVEVATGSSIERVPVLRLPYLTVLKENVSDLEVAVHSLPPEVGLDGLIGLDFLTMYNVFINRSRGILVVQRQRSKNLWDRFMRAVEIWKSMG